MPFRSVYIIARILASRSADIHIVNEKAYSILQAARSICHRWTCELAQKVQGVTSSDEVSKLRRHLCHTALTCLATYDVNSGPHLEALLQSSADVSILVKCSITLHDNTPFNLSKLDLDLQRHLSRNRRMLINIESHLITLILSTPSGLGLDDAITVVWPTYRPGVGAWQRYTDPCSRWVTKTTEQIMGGRSQRVHWNVLSGEMLVDGMPIGRLPREILESGVYQRVFGEVCSGVSVPMGPLRLTMKLQRILDVIPADTPGMEYATRGRVFEYQVSFLSFFHFGR